MEIIVPPHPRRSFYLTPAPRLVIGPTQLWTKTDDRQEMTKLLIDSTHAFLEAVSHGLLFFEMNGKYRWACGREGRDGIRRLLAEEERRDMNRRLHAAKRRGLIVESRIGKHLNLSLTDKGLESLDRMALQAAGPRKDGKLVYVMYDIPEKFRSSRNRLRTIMQRAGFSRYQRSIWRTDRDVASLLKAWLQRHKLEKWVDISIL